MRVGLDPGSLSFQDCNTKYYRPALSVRRKIPYRVAIEDGQRDLFHDDVRT